MAYPGYTLNAAERRMRDEVSSVRYDIRKEIEDTRRMLETPGFLSGKDRATATDYLADLMRRAGNAVTGAIGATFETSNPMGDIAVTSDNKIGGAGYIGEKVSAIEAWFSSRVTRIAFIIVGFLVLAIAIYSMANSTNIVVKK